MHLDFFNSCRTKNVRNCFTKKCFGFLIYWIFTGYYPAVRFIQLIFCLVTRLPSTVQVTAFLSFYHLLPYFSIVFYRLSTVFLPSFYHLFTVSLLSIYCLFTVFASSSYYLPHIIHKIIHKVIHNIHTFPNIHTDLSLNKQMHSRLFIFRSPTRSNSICTPRFSLFPFSPFHLLHFLKRKIESYRKTQTMILLMSCRC